MTLREELQKIVDDRNAELKRFYNIDSEISIDVKHKEASIKLSVMYSLGDFINFDFLSKISTLLGTKDINLENEYFTSGCESCDYGSCDSVTVVARKISVPMK